MYDRPLRLQKITCLCNCDNCWGTPTRELSTCSELARANDLSAYISVGTAIVAAQKLWLLAISERGVRFSALNAPCRNIFEGSSVRGRLAAGMAGGERRDRWRFIVLDGGENRARLDFSTRLANSGVNNGFGFSFGGLWNRARFEDSRVGGIIVLTGGIRFRADPGVRDLPGVRNRPGGWRFGVFTLMGFPLLSHILFDGSKYLFASGIPEREYIIYLVSITNCVLPSFEVSTELPLLLRMLADEKMARRFAKWLRRLPGDFASILYFGNGEIVNKMNWKCCQTL